MRHADAWRCHVRSASHRLSILIGGRVPPLLEAMHWQVYRNVALLILTPDSRCGAGSGRSRILLLRLALLLDEFPQRRRGPDRLLPDVRKHHHRLQHQRDEQGEDVGDEPQRMERLRSDPVTAGVIPQRAADAPGGEPGHGLADDGERQPAEAEADEKHARGAAGGFGESQKRAVVIGNPDP